MHLDLTYFYQWISFTYQVISSMHKFKANHASGPTLNVPWNKPTPTKSENSVNMDVNRLSAGLYARTQVGPTLAEPLGPGPNFRPNSKSM